MIMLLCKNMYESGKIAMLANIYFSEKAPHLLRYFTCCSMKYLSIFFKDLFGGCANDEDHPNLSSTALVLSVP